MLESIWNFFCLHPEITVVGAITLIQVAPIKIDPWSAIVNAFKRLFVGGIESKIDRIAEKVDTLDAQVKEDKAVQARMRILRFADELYDKKPHSKEYFDEILDEIDRYEKYCNGHPDFKNNKTVMSVKIIKETYARLIDEHRF